MEIYCKDWLPPFQENITQEIFKRRNSALKWQFVQVCSSFAGFGAYALTRVYLVDEYRLEYICM